MGLRGGRVEWGSSIVTVPNLNPQAFLCWFLHPICGRHKLQTSGAYVALTKSGKMKFSGSKTKSKGSVSLRTNNKDWVGVL